MSGAEPAPATTPREVMVPKPEKMLQRSSWREATLGAGPMHLDLGGEGRVGHAGAEGAAGDVFRTAAAFPGNRDAKQTA